MTEAAQSHSKPELREIFSGASTRLKTRKSVSPRVTLRLTEVELARLQKAAEGVSISAYIRKKLFGKALWFRVTGAYRKIKLDNEREATLSSLRDRTEMANLVSAQQNERRQFKSQFQFEKKKHEDQLKELFQEIAARQSETGESSSETSRQTKRRRQTPKRSRSP